MRDLTVNSPLLTSVEDDEAVEMVLRPEVRKDELWVHWGEEGHVLPRLMPVHRAAELELLVDVKRVGNGCKPPAVVGHSAKE